MARRLIGLDVGTNAVTLAEVTPGSPPRLDRFGQVALPRDAMREGEVADEAAVIEAIVRLREEVDVKRAAVRVGIASPRLIVRQIEMPVMSRDELASALRFQAGDLIPIPIDEAVLDFAILGEGTGDDGESVMRVLLAAAQQASVMRLVNAVETAGLPVAAVDLVPLALVRALSRASYGDGEGAEGIVSLGGGVTAIVVHEAGVPRFVRVIGSGGRELTDAIASQLEMPVEAAEAVKRQLANGGDDVAAQARTSIERPLAMLLDEIRSSLDYYRNQPGAARMQRVVLTGGTSQLPGIAERLSALVGIPVEHARPRDLIAIGDIRFPDEEYPRLDPYLPAAVGLALGGTRSGTVVDLLPRARRSRTSRTSPSLAVGVAAGAALLLALAVPTVMKNSDISDKKSQRSTLQAENAQLTSEISVKQVAQQQKAQLDGLRTQVRGLLETDVSWARMLNDISGTMPDSVWLTSFQGQLTAPVAEAATPAAPTTDTTTDTTTGNTSDTTVPAAGAGTTGTVAVGGITGQVSFEASGNTVPDVARWIDRIGTLPAFSQLWVSNAAVSTLAEQDVIGFSSKAVLTDAARSNRLAQFDNGEVAP